MIDSLSKLEEDITVKYKTLGLNKNDKQIIEKLINYSQNKSSIFSSDIKNYNASSPEAERLWFV
jgi:hypothetical protein